MHSSRSAETSLVGIADPRWQRALRAIPHDIYHLPQYASIATRSTLGHSVAFVYERGPHLLLLPLLLRDVPGTDLLDATSAYGYPGPVSNAPPETAEDFWRDACQALTAVLARTGAVSCFVRVHPLLPFSPDSLRTVGNLVHHGPTVAIDLRQPAETIWAGFRSNHRRQIRSALRSGVETRFDDWSVLDEFVDCYHETMHRVEAGPEYFFPTDYFGALHNELGPRAHLVTAHLQGTAIGGGLFFEHAGIVQYHLGATRSDYRGLQPMKLVIHDVIRWAAPRDNHVLHLGGGVGGRPDTLFHFKAGFSRLHPIFHTWQIVVDPDAYAALVAHAGVSGDAPSFFPAYRSR